MTPAVASRRSRAGSTAVAFAAAVFIWAAGVPATALAEERPLPAPPDPMEGGWRWGPVHVRPVLKLRDFGFDSNVFLEGSGDEQSDLTGRIVGGLQGQSPVGRRATLTFEILPEYLFYVRTSHLNAFGSTIRARGDVFLKPLSLFAAASRIESTERRGNEIDEPTRVNTSTFSAGLGVRMDRRLSFTAVTETAAIRYLDNPTLQSGSTGECGDKIPAPTLGDLLDRDEGTLTLRAGYRLHGEGNAFVEFARGSSDFTVCNPRDSARSSFQLGFSSDPRAPLSLEIRAGPGRLDAEAPGVMDFHGLLGEATVAWKPTALWRFTAGAGRAAPFSIVGNNLYAEESRFSGAVLRSLGGRFALEGGGERVRLLWPQPDPVFTGLVREDRIHSLFIGGRTRLAEQGDVSLRVGWRRRNSNVPGQGDSQVTILTGAAF